MEEAREHDTAGAAAAVAGERSSSTASAVMPPMPAPPGLVATPSSESDVSSSSAETDPHATISKPLLLQQHSDDGVPGVRTPAPVPPLGVGASPPPAPPEEQDEDEEDEAATPPSPPDHEHHRKEEGLAPPGLRLPPPIKIAEAKGQGPMMTLLAEPAATAAAVGDASGVNENQPASTSVVGAYEAEPEDLEDDEPVAPPPPARGKKLSLSVIACLSYLSMGGLMGLLGPAIPLMARALDVAETALGGAFAARAGGYILGSALVSRIPERCWSRLGVMGVAGVVASVLNAAMPYSGRLAVLLPICFAQGVGLAIISTLGNIVLLELWGAGAGPWLQALHFSFGVGAVVSPLVLGVAGLVPAFSAFAAVGLLPFIAVSVLDACCSLLPVCSRRAHAQHRRRSGSQGGSGPSSAASLSRSPASRLRPPSARRLRQGEEALDHRAPLAPARAGRQRRASRTFSPGFSLGNAGNSGNGLGRAPLLLHDGQQEARSEGYREEDRFDEEAGPRVRRLTLEDLLPETLIMGTMAAQQQHQDGQDEEGGVELGPLLLSPAAAAQAAAQQAATAASHHPFTHPPHHQQHNPHYSASSPPLMASPTGSHGPGAHAMVVPSPLHAGGQGGVGVANAHNNFFSNTSEITVASSLTMTTGQFRSTGGYPGMALRPHNAAHYLGRDPEGEEGGEQAGSSRRNSRGSTGGHQQAQQGAHGGQRPRSDSRGAGGHGGAAAMHAHGHGRGHGPGVTGPLAPLPTSLRWLLTTFLGLYVGAECGFGGWVSTFVLLEKTTTSERHAAFLVSIFWAAITLGRALAVLQAMLIPAAWSLRIQLCLSLGGALAFFITGSASVAAAAACAAVYGYGMSSIYPLVMTWPAEAGFGLDAGATAHLVIGGCIGEATMPVLIGAAMHLVGARALPCAILILAVVLCAQLAIVDCLGKRASARAAAGHGGSGGGAGAEGTSLASSAPSHGGAGGAGGKGGKKLVPGGAGGSLESPIRTFDVDEDDLELGSRLGGAGGIEEVSLAGTEAGHLSTNSICTPGHPYLFLYDVTR